MVLKPCKKACLEDITVSPLEITKSGWSTARKINRGVQWSRGSTCQSNKIKRKKSNLIRWFTFPSNPHCICIVGTLSSSHPMSMISRGIRSLWARVCTHHRTHPHASCLERWGVSYKNHHTIVTTAFTIWFTPICISCCMGRISFQMLGQRISWKNSQLFMKYSCFFHNLIISWFSLLLSNLYYRKSLSVLIVTYGSHCSITAKSISYLEWSLW